MNYSGNIAGTFVIVVVVVDNSIHRILFSADSPVGCLSLCG